MKEKTSYVELGTINKTPPTQAQLDQVEQKINDAILKAVPVICHTTSMKSNNTDDQEESASRPDSLPADYVGTEGVIRTIEIEGLDKNPCCGTHISHLGHLQSVKLLHTETIRGGNTRLYFVFGQRVLANLGELYDLSRQLTKSLSVAPQDFMDSVQRLQLQLRTQTKMVKKWQTQMAAYAVKDLQEQLAHNALALVYDEEGEGGMAYLNLLCGLIKEKELLSDDNKAIVLASGDRQQGGVMMVLAADDAYLKKVVANVTATLNGAKGGGARGRWSGKSPSFVGIEKLMTLTIE
ncbi:unnamed protein product [Absidia cylindrospora]